MDRTNNEESTELIDFVSDPNNDKKREYFLVGDSFYERCQIADIHGREVERLVERRPSTIIRRHGKQMLRAIPEYDAFVYCPRNVDYQRDIVTSKGRKLYNTYKPLPCSEPRFGDISTWHKLVSHLCADDEARTTMLWDYLTILYRYPTHTLPVLCLVSRENGTGKTTFGNALGYLLGDNVTYLSQGDISSQFNGWCRSLVAVVEEMSDGKKALNTIKNASTAAFMNINEKFEKAGREEICIKMVINSNNEREFIHANREDIRYWILKVPKLESFDANFQEKLRAEVPAVMYHLEHREIVAEEESRMWFSAESIRTDALSQVVLSSISPCAKDVITVACEKLAEYNHDWVAHFSEIFSMVSNKFSKYEVAAALKELNIPHRRMVYSDKLISKRGLYYIFPLSMLDDEGASLILQEPEEDKRTLQEPETV
jgi:hypothetical protein